MRSITDILSSKISHQENTWSDISMEVTIVNILRQINSDVHKTKIENLRNKLHNGEKEYYDNYKKQLPAVTFSATFNTKRTKDKLKSYNHLIVLDIDRLDSVQLETTYNCLLNDDYVFAFWRSPSNNGFKGLVALDYRFENITADIEFLHKSAFKKLAGYFFNKYGIELDKSGSDISRLCFLSHDSNLVLKSTCISFGIAEDDIVFSSNAPKKKEIKFNFSSSLDSLYNPMGKNSKFDRKIMTDIIRHLKNKKKSITYTYEEWCKVAMGIANTFTYEIGLNYFLQLSSLDSDKFNDVTSTNFLMNCYETRKGNVNFSSIIYLANQKGYKTKYQKNGVPKTD
ncbi:hypothetical protein I5907_20010 [Panacibacter sp. DH6]|uniref:BT4734-like N-terminal domain-containing protein n=1 Tax=Panacibacter microcysteis TaxID=2793269 RepID=A0A931MD82_9BACT|nr:BT4734/BF3469 family protein [Panacibacter microcysteis]MBG9378531.1 hypothetical protein [Panacibacter microcysteis]